MGKAPSLYFTSSSDSGSKIKHPDELADLLEDIFRTGRPLKVTWVANGYGSDPRSVVKVRNGRAKSWEFSYDTIHDVGWKITFEWFSRGQKQEKVAKVRNDSIADACNELRTRGEQLQQSMEDKVIDDILAKRPLERAKLPNALTLSKLQAFAESPKRLLANFTRSVRKITSSLQQIADVADTVRTLPFEMWNSVAGTTANTVAIANQYYMNFTRMPPELSVLSTKASDVIRSIAHFGKFADEGRRLSRQAKALNLRAQEQGQIKLAINPKKASGENNFYIYVAKSGDTLQTISKRFYGIVDRSVDIAKANGLPWQTIKVTRGKVLIIPKTPSGTI
jgi:LysM repeat protein